MEIEKRKCSKLKRKNRSLRRGQKEYGEKVKQPGGGRREGGNSRLWGQRSPGFCFEGCRQLLIGGARTENRPLFFSISFFLSLYFEKMMDW